MDDLPQPSGPPEDANGRRPRSGHGFWAGIGRSRRVQFIILAACLCVIVAGVSIAVFSSRGGSEASHLAGADNSLGAIQAGGAQTTAPVPPSRGSTVTSDGIAKTALQAPPELKDQILRWKAGPGGAALSSVTLQLGTAMQAAGVKTYVPMKLACRSLASSINAAQAAPPIPDGAMQRLYTKALAGLSGAAADCRNAVSSHPDGDETLAVHVNTVLLNRSMAELAAKSKLLYKATAEIRALRH